MRYLTKARILAPTQAHPVSRAELRRSSETALTWERTPAGILFKYPWDRQWGTIVHLDTGWTLNLPPGLRARVVEVPEAAKMGIRIVGPVTVGGQPPTPLRVWLDSDTSMRADQPLFLLAFEQDINVDVDCFDGH